MKIIQALNDNFFWGVPMIVFMLGIGIYLTFKTKGVIFRKFGTVMKYTAGTIFGRKKKADDEGAITPFQAVSTALAATVGTGNIVGVAVAIQVGGPGSIFWMVVAGLIGMVTKYAEVTLAFAYRERDAEGNLVGGPMYYLEKGVGMKWLAVLFAVAGALSSFGIGNMVQANSLTGAVNSTFGVPNWVSGLILAIVVGMVIIGGIKRISSVAEVLVPFMAILYIVGAAVVLVVNRSEIPAAIVLIFKDAFTGTAAVGGFAGSTILYGMRIGIARGVFTNEAGLGSAPIAHAAAENDHPARQGLWGAFEVFVDTIVMCTITALVVITSGLWNADPMYSGNEVTQVAFGNAFPGGEYVVSIGLVLFVFATVIGWYYYGESCTKYVWGQKGIRVYQVLYVIALFVGSLVKLDLVWELADLLNAWMAIPNLIGLLVLSRVVKNLTEDFFKDPARIRPKNEDFSKFLIYKN